MSIVKLCAAVATKDEITKLLEELVAQNNSLQEENARMKTALERISKWFGEFPETGRYWDRNNADPMSYAAVHGSHGERDYMRKIASDALENIAEPFSPEADNCILVWAWNDTPKYLKAVHSCGGDEEWLAVLPPKYVGQWVGWLDDGTPFGCCSIKVYPHPTLAGYEVRIGTHS